MILQLADNTEALEMAEWMYRHSGEGHTPLLAKDAADWLAEQEEGDIEVPRRFVRSIQWVLSNQTDSQLLSELVRVKKRGVSYSLSH